MAEEAPGSAGAEVGEAAELVGLREPALVDGDERHDALLDGLPILDPDLGGVPVRRAQVQRVAAVTAAAKRKSQDTRLLLPIRGVHTQEEGVYL